MVNWNDEIHFLEKRLNRFMSVFHINCHINSHKLPIFVLFSQILSLEIQQTELRYQTLKKKKKKKKTTFFGMLLRNIEEKNYSGNKKIVLLQFSYFQNIFFFSGNKK